MDSLTVKQALIAIAKEEKKPPYEMCVVRDVTKAFRENTDHHLKDKILARSPFYSYKKQEKKEKIKVERTPFVSEKELSENNKWLIELCKPKGMTMILIGLLNASNGFFTNYKNGRYELSDSLVKKIKDVEDQAKKLLAERDKAQELKTGHGTVTRYMKGCRCEPCRRASRKKRAALNKKAMMV